eukprot:Blabericola_migrator_1__10280@NODE_5763_length_678_cov_411_630115_g3779_i0_p1_GENE_NODE_5763_length_678_cov_411_630115_g3779_i0NODE_5763_length_678_cov_411_630115_g3779_i0_p1_ORF_typecomplete_len124_score31_39C2/PF00168_30/7_5e12_NODE_5763_length_678_cov_411_630115_g3779_i0112483
MHCPRQLRVTVVSAYNMPKKCGFRDVTDPFIEIQIGAQRQRTSTKIDAGSEAQYNELLNFTYNGEPDMVVFLYDENKKKNDLLGTGRLALTSQILAEGFRGVVQAQDKKGKALGDVLLHVMAY